MKRKKINNEKGAFKWNWRKADENKRFIFYMTEITTFFSKEEFFSFYFVSQWFVIYCNSGPFLFCERFKTDFACFLFLLSKILFSFVLQWYVQNPNFFFVLWNVLKRNLACFLFCQNKFRLLLFRNDSLQNSHSLFVSGNVVKRKFRRFSVSFRRNDHFLSYFAK